MQAKQRDEGQASSWRMAGVQLVPPVLNVLLNECHLNTASLLAVDFQTCYSSIDLAPKHSAVRVQFPRR